MRLAALACAALLALGATGARAQTCYPGLGLPCEAPSARIAVGQPEDAEAPAQPLPPTPAAPPAGPSTGQPVTPPPAPQPVPEVAVAPPPAPPVLPPPSEGLSFVARVNAPPDDWLALRDAPDRSGRLLLQMPAGTPFAVTGRQGDWLAVRLLDGRTGFTHSSRTGCCLTRPGEAGGPSGGEAPYHFVAYVNPAPDDWLALRDAPARSGRLLTRMPFGTPFEMLEPSGNWRRVRLFDGREGWAHSAWIGCCMGRTGTLSALGAAAAPARFHYVSFVNPAPDDWLALRDAPSAKTGRLLAKMPLGTRLTRIGESGNWLEVELADGRRGWAFGGWIGCCVAQ